MVRGIPSPSICTTSADWSIRSELTSTGRCDGKARQRCHRPSFFLKESISLFPLAIPAEISPAVYSILPREKQSPSGRNVEGWLYTSTEADGFLGIRSLMMTCYNFMLMLGIWLLYQLDTDMLRRIRFPKARRTVLMLVCRGSSVVGLLIHLGEYFLKNSETEYGGSLKFIGGEVYPSQLFSSTLQYLPDDLSKLRDFLYGIRSTWHNCDYCWLSFNLLALC